MSRVIRKSESRPYHGYGPTQLDEQIAKGNFPQPISLSPGGRAKAFFEEELLDWQRWRRATRDGTFSGSWAEWVNQSKETQ